MERKKSEEDKVSRKVKTNQDLISRESMFECNGSEKISPFPPRKLKLSHNKPSDCSIKRHHPAIMSNLGSGAGAAVVAEALKKYGVKYCFGVVGIPIIEVGVAFQNAGLIYIGCRNEQAASYAAGAVGYLTGTPGVCLCVPGPGLVHGLAGLANSKENGWPMILLAGSSDTSLDSMMSFQESPQIEFARPYVKYAARFDSVERIPFYIEKAIRISMSGRPGPVYLDIPGELVNRDPDESKLVYPVPRGPIPGFIADTAEIEKACAAMIEAKKPLILVGKGMQIGRAEKEVLQLVEMTGFPFLPSPLGKGVVPDNHAQNVIAARSTALENAELVILLGSRLNWINHFGLPPRFNAKVKIIQVDILPEAMGDNVPNVASLVGHGPLVVKQLCEALAGNKRFKRMTGEEPFWKDLKSKVQTNVKKSTELACDDCVPMNYYHPITLIQNFIRENCPDCFM